MVQEQPDITQESPDQALLTDEGEETAAETEVTQPLTVEALQEQIAALEEKLQDAPTRRDLQTFSAQVGRMQSMMTQQQQRQPEQSPDIAAIQSRIQAEGSDLDALVAALQQGAQDLLPDNVQSVLRDIATRRQRTSSQAALRELLNEELEKRLPQQRQQEVPQQEVSPLEQSIREWITGSGLTLDNPVFDWSEANRIMQSQGQGPLMSYFAEKIAEGQAGQRRTQRRQAASPSPRAAAPAATGIDRDLETLAGDGNLDERIQVLRDQGILHG